jgi:hypothetical protein
MDIDKKIKSLCLHKDTKIRNCKSLASDINNNIVSVKDGPFLVDYNDWLSYDDFYNYSNRSIDIDGHVVLIGVRRFSKLDEVVKCASQRFKNVCYAYGSVIKTQDFEYAREAIMSQLSDCSIFLKQAFLKTHMYLTDGECRFERAISEKAIKMEIALSETIEKICTTGKMYLNRVKCHNLAVLWNKLKIYCTKIPRKADHFVGVDIPKNNSWTSDPKLKFRKEVGNIVRLAVRGLDKETVLYIVNNLSISIPNSEFKDLQKLIHEKKIML